MIPFAGYAVQAGAGHGADGALNSADRSRSVSPTALEWMNELLRRGDVSMDIYLSSYRDFAPVREEKDLARLPAAERAQWKIVAEGHTHNGVAAIEEARSRPAAAREKSVTDTLAVPRYEIPVLAIAPEFYLALTHFPDQRMSPSREVRHLPVMPGEVLRLLDPQPGRDLGGLHSRHRRARSPHRGADRSDRKVHRARPGPDDARACPDMLAGLPVELVHANFDQLPEVLRNRGIDAVDGMLADLGFASDQMDQPDRASSFRAEGPLDMRLDPTAGTTAAEMVNRMSEAGLADLFYEFGEERQSRRVARRIVERRQGEAVRHHERARRPRAEGAAAEVGRHRPRDARLPGAPDRGQRRARARSIDSWSRCRAW